jgi:hypothetical protein
MRDSHAAAKIRNDPMFIILALIAITTRRGCASSDQAPQQEKSSSMQRIHAKRAFQITRM